MTFTGLFDLFKGLFSRTFWFGAFLPLAIFAAANLTVAGLLFPGAVKREEWTKVGDAPLTNIAIAFVVLVVAAYAAAPLIPMVRGLFDGTFLPAWLHNWLRDQRTAEARKIREARASAKDCFGEFDAMLSREAESVLTNLRQAYGGTLHGPPRAPPPDVSAVFSELTRLEGDLDRGRALAPTEVENAARKVASLLDVRPVPNGVDADRLYTRTIQLLQDARRDADHRWRTLAVRHRGLALNDPQATQIGDARVLVQSYPSNVYGVDFDYVWPRLQLVVPKDSPLNERIATAQGQVDFAVLTLSLSLLFSLFWLPLLAVYAASPWPVLLLGAAMPLVVLFFYQLLFESEAVFGEVVKLVIDQHRLDLLTKVLRQPMPATLFAERRLWERLVLAEQPGTGTDLTYRHPSPGAAG